LLFVANYWLKILKMPKEQAEEDRKEKVEVEEGRKKKKLEASSSDDDSSSDSGPDDKLPVKKAKIVSSGKKEKDEEPSWELEKKRFVKVRQFKGTVYVDIREFYDAGGELKPGKKGISLTAGQWKKLKDIIPEVDEAVKNF